MATRTNGTPTVGSGAVRHSLFTVVWAVWAVLTAHEYVGDVFGLPLYLVLLVGGFPLGVVFFAWIRRTERGRMAKRLYDDAPSGQQLMAGVVLMIPLAAVAYVLTLVDMSLVVLLVLWMSAIVGYQQSMFVATHAEPE
ncbi:hypothetical protein [Halococcus sp. AFM35]|uniref:hypothetical protein n=1 Tax=Halococcus sp. AFM35 TaxID=3421653 RepID=UPI003EBA27BC